MVYFRPPSCTTSSTSLTSLPDANHQFHSSSDLSDSIIENLNEQPSLGLFAQTTQPLPIRSTGVRSTSPVEQLFSSPLSNSWESISSTKSSSSSRSSAEREAERAQRRQLLETSLIKLRQPNLPLRKHLLVYETIKQIQKDLDLLDDEDVFCSLMDSADSMEDEDVLLTSSWHLAPPSAVEDEPMEAMDMEIDCLCPLPSSNQMSGWGAADQLQPISDSMFDVFESLNKSTYRSKWADNDSMFLEQGNATATGCVPGGRHAAWSTGRSTSLWTSVDTVNAEDPLLGGGSPATWGHFELSHLFPSQLLSQA